ncbi:MAG: chemotaxis protein CheW [Phycisphaerales bacterium]|nr:chemotaxis protein CheW [Phycisphaerales bacterium]
MTGLGVIWRTSGLLMAIESRSIIEVLSPVSCRPMPGAPNWIRGLFVYRGTLIPLVDTARLLGAPPASDRRANRVIVVRIHAAGKPVDWPVGLWVESVLEIERIEFAAAGGHPGFATEAGRFLGPVARTRWGQVQLVTPDEIFTAEQAEIMTQRLSEAAA